MIRLLILPALVLAIACGEEEAPTESAEPVVGALELPISLRHGPAPTGAVRIEVAPDRLRVDGHTIMEVAGGEIPMTERSGDQGGLITKLAQALSSGPARRSAQLRLHANTPYRTAALVLSTIKRNNINEVSFEVRQGSSTEIGYLTVSSFETRLESDEWAQVPATHQRLWSELEPIWADMYTSCREEHYVDCAFKPGAISQGGKMQITLFARGNALKVELHQFEAPEQPARPNAPSLLEGVAPAAAPEEEVEPATTAAFTWRFQASTSDPSVVAKTLQPLCGARPCGAMVTAEAQTPTMRLVSLIGAAFPNGTDAPHLLFQIPRR